MTAPPKIDLAPVRIGNWRWLARPDVSLPAVSHVLSDPEVHLADVELQFKSSRVVTVARVPAARSGGPNLVLRRLNYGKLRHRLRDLFRPSRAHRALMRGLLLERAGIRTPRALAVAEVRRWRWPVAVYLLTEEISGAGSLAEFVAAHKRCSRELIVRLADLIGRLHERGYSNRDLKASNVLLDSELHPWLIDLDGIRDCGRVPISRVVADLTRFAANFLQERDRLRWAGARFLVRYCQARNLGSGVRKDLARRIGSALGLEIDSLNRK